MWFLAGAGGLARADEAPTNDPASAPACPFPASDANELATKGLVRAARAKLDQCLGACEGAERERCATARAALRVPTIVVTVADTTPEAAPRTDVRVLVDGEAQKPNVPIEVDPGAHLVQVQGPRIGAERKVTVAPDATKLAVPFETPKVALEVEAAQGGKLVWPWVFVGLGFTGIVVGMITAIAAEMFPVRDPESSDPYPPYVPNPTFRKVGIGTVVTGIAFVAGGIIWHFLDKTGSSPAKPKTGFSPWVAPGAGWGVAFTQTF